MTVHSNAGDVIRRWNKLGPEIRDGVRRACARRLIVVESRVRRNSEIKARTGAAGLMGRLGSYARSEQNLGLDAGIGFRKRRGFPYELSQEFGAKAKPGHAMAIPVSNEARRLSGAGVSARKFPRRLDMIGRKLQETRKRAKPVTHYVLVKSIRGRLHFRKTVLASLDYIGDGIVEGAKEGMAQA